MQYTLEMTDGGAYGEATIDADSDDAAVAMVAVEVDRWVQDGSWPDDPAPVRVAWTLGRTVASGEIVVPVRVVV